MGQDVAVVGQKVAVTMDTQLKRQKDIRTCNYCIINQMSLAVSENNQYRICIQYFILVCDTVYIMDGLPCILKLISSVLSRPHQFLPLPTESHETTTRNIQQVDKCKVPGVC